MESQGSPDPERELFRQLEGLGSAVVGDELQQDLEFILYEQEQHRRQCCVLERLQEKQVPFIDLVLQYLEKDSLVRIIRLFDEIFQNESLEDEIRLRAISVRRICALVVRITDEMDGSRKGMRELQVEIIATELLSPEVKSALLEVANELVEGEGYDTSDPAVMLGALVRHQAEEERIEQGQACRARANELLEERDFLDRYNIHPDDPVWLNFREFAALSLARWVLDEEHVDSVAHHLELQAEVLQQFGIDREAYTSLLDRVKQVLRVEFG